MNWRMKPFITNNKLKIICKVVMFSHFAFVANTSHYFSFAIVVLESYHHICSTTNVRNSETISDFKMVV
jgi:hypothetical protein